MFSVKLKTKISAWLKRLINRAPLQVQKPAEKVAERPLLHLGFRPCSCGENLSEGWVCKCNYHLIADRDK
jgi:hypothetical protein